MTTIKANVEQPLVIERMFRAPLAKVWSALTDVSQMREWYFDLKDFRAVVGFEFEFTVEHEGTSYHHLCRVTEVIPEKRIAYTWRYADQPGNSIVTFDLSEDGDVTRLKLTHQGLETFPQTPQYARQNFEAGWTALTAELGKFVESKG
jgi:uncharacterized protein YndB with AHSA1/START domain